MKKTICTLLAVTMAFSIYSQEPELSKKEQKQLQKELKKEQQAEEAAKKAALVALMIEYQQFVLEADHLRDKQGNMVTVPSMINFLAIDSISGVIQIGSNQYAGLNGVGGITIEGPISNYEVSLNEKNSTYNISYNIRSTMGHFDITMSVFSDGRADATVSSNWPGRVSYTGYLVPIADSRVYKGTSSF
ncbi:MAG: DUF4251 domain-containing protein [Bacteroidota bacterium]